MDIPFDTRRLVSFFVGQVSQQVDTNDPLINGFLSWVGKLQESAQMRWRTMVSSGQSCAIPAIQNGRSAPCPLGAVTYCVACRAPTCLGHAFVAASSEVICFRCASATVQGVAARQAHPHAYEPGPSGQQRPRPEVAQEPPEEDLRREHLRTIGIKAKHPDWATIEKAYKAKLIKLHPDRAPTDQRAEYEQKFKRVRAAYDWLSARETRKVA